MSELTLLSKKPELLWFSELVVLEPPQESKNVMLARLTTVLTSDCKRLVWRSQI